ncbi:MAG: hypothetical protein ABSF24_06750 [Candidatus Bathyarchaeia archaeon]
MKASESLKTKVKSYNPYTRARNNQQIYKTCPDCGRELMMYRESGHQHWRPTGRACPELVEWNYVVYIRCGICGGLVKTRLKPMSKSMPKDLARQWKLIP